MADVSLICVVVGEKTPFSIDIADGKTVDHLKVKITERKGYKFQASELELYQVIGLAQDENEQILYNGTTIDMPNCSLVNFGGSVKKLAAAFPLSSYPKLIDSFVGISSKAMKDLTRFPNVDELPALLLQPLPFQVEVMDALLWQDLFAPNAQHVECALMTSLFNAITVKSNIGQTQSALENSWQSYYDSYLDVTQSICLAFDILTEKQRNEADTSGSTAGKLRPDCLIRTTKGLVLLRGEERNSMIDISIPLRELTKKMTKWNPMFYGELPYTLGYATSGDLMSIVAINCYDVHTIISNQSLLKAQERVNLLKIFYHLAFFFELMEVKSKRTTAIRLMPFVLYTTPKRTLQLVDSGIRRTYVADVDRMTKIYAALMKINSEFQGRTHLQIVSDMNPTQTELKVLLTPLGFERQSLTIEELRDWVFGMLTALNLWHGAEYCHGDIRWRNIVFVPTDAATGYWMLIDMDESYAPNTHKIDWIHEPNGKTLTYQHDLRQLGKLLAGLGFELPVKLENLKNALLVSVGTKTTAQDLLKLL
ncbi:hypothetical protein AeMF1_006457 [Aphanomyces euteiches]|nr:hypothetical protein AeMF1_006457 [Aphanomyces euteiches]